MTFRTRPAGSGCVHTMPSRSPTTRNTRLKRAEATLPSEPARNSDPVAGIGTVVGRSPVRGRGIQAVAAVHCGLLTDTVVYVARSVVIRRGVTTVLAPLPVRVRLLLLTAEAALGTSADVADRRLVAGRVLVAGFARLVTTEEVLRLCQPPRRSCRCAGRSGISRTPRLDRRCRRSRRSSDHRSRCSWDPL